MALENLLEDTFRRGCGVSRAYALKGSRYRELMEEFPHIPHTKPHEAAEMALLGEMIADKAFMNLPKHLREAAHLWSGMNEDEHQAVITELMQQLKSQQWKPNSSSGRDGGRSPYESLPASAGSWRRGKYQPNCLGVAQMLVGFARKTGIPYLLVDAHHDRHLYGLRASYRAINEIERLTEPYEHFPRIKKLRKVAQTHQRAQLYDLATNAERQSHKCLLAFVDDRWLLIDPYLLTCYRMKGLTGSLNRIHQAIMKRPSRHAILISHEMEREFDAPVEAVRLAIEALESTEIKRYAVEVLEITTTFYNDWENRTELSQRLNKVMFTVLVSQCFYIARWSKPRFDDPQTQDSYVREIFDRPNRSMTLRKRFFKRVFIEVVRDSLRLVASLEISPPGEHPLIELSHPTLHLAVATLNHQAFLTEQPAPDLIRFDRSMSILHDTYADIAEGQSRRLQYVQRCRMRELKRLHPKQVLLELRGHINKETENAA